jgi:outer membrane immunogenic protein
MKKLLLVAAAAGLWGAPALAADMPVKAAPYAAPAPLFNWTGCYVGGNAGYGWSREKVFDALPGGVEVNNVTADGAVAGGQLGCDVQSSAWVFGVRGLWDWADLKKTDPELNPAFIDHLTIRSFARVTGRVGYAIQPDSLLYVDGGWAWMKTHFHLQSPTGGTADFWNGGWTVGVGWEKMISPNWSFFIEYEYADLGKKRDIATGTALTNLDQNLNVVLIGLNYRFASGR